MRTQSNFSLLPPMNGNDSPKTVSKEWGGGGGGGRCGHVVSCPSWDGIDDLVWVRGGRSLWEGNEIGRFILARDLGQCGRPVAAVVVAVGTAQPAEAYLDVGAVWAAMRMPTDARQPLNGRMVAVATDDATSCNM